MQNNEKQSTMSYCQRVANEIFHQLFWSIDQWTFGSWGVSMRMCTTYKDMPTLMLHVSGLLHKGWVYISLDESSDCYIVTLMNENHKVMKTINDVYCDNLGTIIDGLVEKPSDTTTQEYRNMALKDSEAKWKQMATRV